MIMPVRVVVVDDAPKDLLLIGTALTAAGIPISPHWYDREEISVDKRLKPPPPAGGYVHIRLLISDLNLDEIPATQELATVLGPVIIALRQLVGGQTGPYVLVFWTGTSHKVEDIRSALLPRLAALNIPEPFAIEEINKAEFVTFTLDPAIKPDPLIPLYRHAHDHAAALKTKIGELLAKHGMLNMLTQWEARASVAAGAAINGIFAAAKVDDPKNASASLTRISALISRETVGSDLARQEPARAFDAAMVDLLIDHFGRSVTDTSYRKLAVESLGSALKKEPYPAPGRSTVAALNSRFQLDTNVNGIRFRDRGAVISLEIAKQHELSIIPAAFMWDDFFWRPSKSESSRQKRREKEISIAITKQLPDDAGMQAKISAAFDKIGAEKKKELKARYDTFKKDVAAIEAKVTWVLVEIGADCDHAQGKTRTLRFVLAAQYPANFDEYVYSPEGQLRNGALRKLGPFQDKSGEFNLLVSFKRFVTWQLVQQGPEPSIPVLYRLRKSVVDELLHRYASWSSRAGIVEFVVTE